LHLQHKNQLFSTLQQCYQVSRLTKNHQARRRTKLKALSRPSGAAQSSRSAQRLCSTGGSRRKDPLRRRMGSTLNSRVGAKMPCVDACSRRMPHGSAHADPMVDRSRADSDFSELFQVPSASRRSGFPAASASKTLSKKT